MKSKISLFIFYCFTISLFAQKKAITYYLPDIQYNADITSPEQFLGFQVGEWHVSHDQLYHYMRLLAKQSDRITLTEYARTHENRPVIYLTITSPENHKNLEDLKVKHKKLTFPSESDQVNIEDIPIVIYQGYTVHGNEASGSNAALLNAYYLAAGLDEEVRNKLDEMIILLDPCYNPDGMHRFSTWVNMHKASTQTADPNDREYNEAWPGGRTNHYWFDLNRDWLFITHPESEGRMLTFHEWKPDILTDHHEMGTNRTFFFQPGIPTRVNPNTPQKNQVLTEEIARYHAAALDEIKSLYYTKASYDDYFYGKGSTFPDVNGGVGILFEQASSRGHVQESDHGLLEFAFTIKNQVATSLSTQEAGINLKEELLEYKRKFFKDAAADAKRSNIKGHLLMDYDIFKLDRFLAILRVHDIKAYRIVNPIGKNGLSFTPENAVVIPTEQYQYKLIKTIFEKVREFEDSVFYDVSAWTGNLAFDLNHAALSSAELSKVGMGQEITASIAPSGSFVAGENPYAYIFRWVDYYAPAALYQLQKLGIRTSVATKPMVLQTLEGIETFGRGSILIPKQNQEMDESEIVANLQAIANTYHLKIIGLETGYGNNNQTVGHPSVEVLQKPEIALLIGTSTRSYDAGEVWHQLDMRYQIPITKLEIARISTGNLSRYNVLIIAGANPLLSEKQKNTLNSWISAGGNLIVTSHSVDWAVSNKIIYLEKKKINLKKTTEGVYASVSADRGGKALGGSIFMANGDLTHPLLFGYKDEIFPTFRRGTTFYHPTTNIYATPLKYDKKEPCISGYIPRGSEDLAMGAAALTIHGKGRGRIVAIMDNPVFRGYWWGGNKLLANAIFFADIIGYDTLAN